MLSRTLWEAGLIPVLPVFLSSDNDQSHSADSYISTLTQLLDCFKHSVASKRAEPFSSPGPGHNTQPFPTLILLLIYKTPQIFIYCGGKGLLFACRYPTAAISFVKMFLSPFIYNDAVVMD